MTERDVRRSEHFYSLRASREGWQTGAQTPSRPRRFLPALPPRDREAARAARAWSDYSPQKAPRLEGGAESRPGAHPSGVSGRA